VSQQPIINPKRGEIWRVQLDPVRGSEQGKTRPVVVLSQPPIGRPTMRLCASITGSKPEHQAMVWCAILQPDAGNGLSKDSTADTAQTRALDVARFEAKLGKVSASKMDEIKAALIRAIGGAPSAEA
jgi:mRNA interferase MazF